MRRSSDGRFAVRDQISTSSNLSVSDSLGSLVLTILTNALEILHLVGVESWSLNQSPSVNARVPPLLRTLYHSDMTFAGSGTVQSM